MLPIDDRTEWLEPDGLGGFASGTTNGTRTRRYHALLLTALTPPTGRVVLVNGFEAWVDTPHGSFALSTQRYVPDVLYPDGATRVQSFTYQPWPTWVFALPGAVRIRQEVCVQHGTGVALAAWTLLQGNEDVVLRVRPLLSGRDYHSTHHENGSFRFDADVHGDVTVFRPYGDLPAIAFRSNATYRHAPEWYRQFLYREEQERGLDAVEDLASPGEFAWTLKTPDEQAIWLINAVVENPDQPTASNDATAIADAIRKSETARRARFATDLERSADAYLVQRRAGRTIVAGYPWFTDWGRDTFISLRGLCLATNRFADAYEILLEWADAISEGMLPNRFPDRGETPEFNSVDASLWYVVTTHEFLQLAKRQYLLTDAQRERLEQATRQIVDGYAHGTRFGIRMDSDGLLAAGVPGMQLTWMDARIGDHVVTPRIGKPVEIQALWLNALAAVSDIDAGGRDFSPADAYARGLRSFHARFLNEDGSLADVVDVNHVSGTRDSSFRPNQIFAIGGLPIALLEGDHARRVVDAVEERLLTPLGLRSLAPGEPGYCACCNGSAWSRDCAYHQGTVWPWLLGPFVEAWVRVRGNTDDAKREARARFITPMRAHLDVAGLGHVSEITDADPPFTPRGCPFQAWSLGELLRLDRVVLAEAVP